MVAKDKPAKPILLVQPTGSGKSTVPQTSSITTSGVTFIVECTQSLGSDQASKIKQASTSDHTHVYGHQLDLVKTTHERIALANNIISVMDEKKHSSIDQGIVSFILFTSPEALLDPTWNKLFDDLLQMEMLTLFCIDVVHLFVEFGLSFRKEFLSLRDKVFSKLQLHMNNLVKADVYDFILHIMSCIFYIYMTFSGTVENWRT